MVRNLVLTPFIDLGLSHFMFSREIMQEFFMYRPSRNAQAQTHCACIIFPSFLPIGLLIGQH